MERNPTANPEMKETTMLLKGSNTRARVLTALENSGYVGDGELIRAARFLEMRDGTEYHEITYVDPEGDKLTKAKGHRRRSRRRA